MIRWPSSLDAVRPVRAQRRLRYRRCARWTYCLPYVVAVSRGCIPRRYDPIQPRNIVLPKDQTHLCGMFLHMPHAVQLQLQETELHSFKHTALLRCLIG